MMPLQFCRTALSMLSETDPSMWAERWVRMRMDFCRRYTQGYIFSTRFGINFFEDVESFLLGDKFLRPEKGEVLSEYDKNFNNWLKVARTIK